MSLRNSKTEPVKEKETEPETDPEPVEETEPFTDNGRASVIKTEYKAWLANRENVTDE